MGKEKVVSLWVVLFFFFCCCCCCVVECRGGGGEGEGEEERDMVVVVVVSILLGCITGCVSALVCGCLVSFIFRYIKRPPLLKGPVVFSPLISPKSLQSALVQNQNPTTSDTNSNSNLLILLDNGLTVSMKKLEVPCLKKKNRRRIQRELHILGSLRHTSLLPLLAYYVTTDNTTTTFYLVYDYLPSPTEEEEGGGCTLHDAIIGRSRSRIKLPWEARLRIAVGIIKGLHYLHLSCSPPVLHYDLQPSNVLLDSQFQPHLALSGLPNTFHLLSSPTSPPYYYYYAPECFPNFTIYTEKSDIFSFGVILGMLLTGRDPSDPLFGSGMGIWFRQVLEAGDGREALDKTLLGQEMEEDEMLMAVRIAAVCLSDMPLDRPSTDELLPMLTQLHSF